MSFAATPDPPYYAVIFTSLRSDADLHGYELMAAKMAKLSAAMQGYLGIESARDSEGVGITVSYWDSEAAILAWKQHAVHLLAQATGKERWYEHYEVRVAKVERAYRGPEGRAISTSSA